MAPGDLAEASRITPLTAPLNSQGLTSVLEHVFGEIKGDDPPGAHPIYEDVVRSAAVHGQLSTLEWCLRHGMLAHELGTAYEMMDGAAAHRQFNVLEWALSKGLVNSEQMSVVLSHVLKERQGHLPVSGAPTGEQVSTSRAPPKHLPSTSRAPPGDLLRRTALRCSSGRVATASPSRATRAPSPCAPSSYARCSGCAPSASRGESTRCAIRRPGGEYYGALYHGALPRLPAAARRC